MAFITGMKGKELAKGMNSLDDLAEKAGDSRPLKFTFRPSFNGAWLGRSYSFAVLLCPAIMFVFKSRSKQCTLKRMDSGAKLPSAIAAIPHSQKKAPKRACKVIEQAIFSYSSSSFSSSLLFW